MQTAPQLSMPGRPARTTGIRLASLFLFILFTASCAQNEVATPKPVVVQIAGATSMHPVLEDLSKAFTERNPSVLIELRGGGSALGEARVRSGRSALGASTLLPDSSETPEAQADQRPPSDERDPESAIDLAGGELDVGVIDDSGASEAGADDPLMRAPIGIDGVAIVVHHDNAVTSLTSEQIRDIFSGRILDWTELGEGRGEIVLVSREDGSGAREAFENIIMGNTAVSLTAVVMPTGQDVVDYVSRTPLAIGYVSSAFVLESPVEEAAATPGESEPRALPVQVVAVNGVKVSDETIRNQSYPVIQPLYLVTREAPQGWVRRFIDFALSPAGQTIVDKYHVPVR